jgi:hypothetical protein
MSAIESDNYEYTWKIDGSHNPSNKLYEDNEYLMIYMCLAILVLCLFLLVANCYQDFTLLGGGKDFRERERKFNMIYRL